MALFGSKESAEIAALQQQLAASQATIAELRGWVWQLRGAQAGALEAELRWLDSAVEQSRREYATLGASRQQLQAEVNACRSQPRSCGSPLEKSARGAGGRPAAGRDAA